MVATDILSQKRIEPLQRARWGQDARCLFAVAPSNGQRSDVSEGLMRFNPDTDSGSLADSGHEASKNSCRAASYGIQPTMVGQQRRRDLTSRVDFPSPSPFRHSQRTSTSDGNSEFGLINCVTSTGSSVEGSSTLEIACADPSRIIGANLFVALHALRRCEGCSPGTMYGKVRETQPQTAETKKAWKWRLQVSGAPQGTG